MKKGSKKLLFIATGLFFPLLALAAMNSETYSVESDVVGSFGNRSVSENYVLEDTGSEAATGPSSSENYSLAAGFWHTAIEYEISMACDAGLSLGDIYGSGRSDLTNNKAVCNIFTDNPPGYSLLWQTDSPEMISASNSNDKIGAYTPAISGVAENWSVEQSASEWGARLGAGSTTADTDFWGTGDTYESGKWLDIGTGDFEIARRTNRTAPEGDDEYIWFGAEVGTGKAQSAGDYVADITITAIAL